MKTFCKIIVTLLIILTVIRLGMRHVIKTDVVSKGEKSFSITDVYVFKVPSMNYMENRWRDNLAKACKGKKEVKVHYGRIDVATKNSVIEVEYLNKWHEGLGQVEHYAYETHKQGILAIISYDLKDQDKISYIKKLCKQYNIKVVVLTNFGKPSEKTVEL